MKNSSGIYIKCKFRVWYSKFTSRAHLWEHSSLQDSVCLFKRKHVKKSTPRGKRCGCCQCVFVSVSVCVYLSSYDPLLPWNLCRHSGKRGSPWCEVGPTLPTRSQPRCHLGAKQRLSPRLVVLGIFLWNLGTTYPGLGSHSRVIGISSPILCFLLPHSTTLLVLVKRTLGLIHWKVSCEKHPLQGCPTS